MFKKLSTTKLLIIFAVLAGIVLFNKFYLSKKEESTFREEFVKIDTAAVTSISIFPPAAKGKEIKFTKNGKQWELQCGKIKTIADSNAVRSILVPFADMKSGSLAGIDKSSWKDLQVNDSAGTKIKITTEDNHVYNMVVGKFGFDPSTRSGLSYIRHEEEEAVYSIEGYLSYMVTQPLDAWRNKTFIKGNSESWTSITFTYPDSSFVLSKSNNVWTVNGQQADSAKTMQYLNQLASVQGSGFVDGYTPSSTPIFLVSIVGNNQSVPINIQAYPSDSTYQFILHSSLNPDAYFSEAQSRLKERVFKGRGEFLR